MATSLENASTSISHPDNTNSNAGNNSYQIIRDPKVIKNRIFVGNLPICTRKQLESICQPYGNILGSAVMNNFGFVQFESEEIANKAAAAINGSTFKGCVITSHNAGFKKNPPNKPVPLMMLTPQVPMRQPLHQQSDDHNDCEIIVLDRKNSEYAEFIEERLKRFNLRVDLLFPNSDVPLGKVLSNISTRQCLYAVLVTNQHQQHNSVTVNILYGAPAEHRNMPVEDAILLIGADFRKKIAQDSGGLQAPLLNMYSNMLPTMPKIRERHPENIQMLINSLADNARLTVLQFDCIIKYLQELREEQIGIELGTNEPIVRSKTPDPEIELQKRILSIMSKPSVAENNCPLMYASLEAAKEDAGLMNLLKDERVQRALDSLMDSNLVSTIESHMKF